MHATTMQLTCLACLTLSSLEVDHTAVVLSLPFLAVNTTYLVARCMLCAY